MGRRVTIMIEDSLDKKNKTISGQGNAKRKFYI
jgi:hypothetical protein